MIAAEVKYKKTEIDWMPEVPEDWGMQRAKTIFVERSIKNKPNEPLLAASQTQGVVLKSMLEQRSMEAIQNFETFKLVEINDFVISLRSFEGGVELAYFKGIISPVYNIFRARNIEYVDVNYFKFIFKSSLFIQELNVYKTGIRDGQSISYKNFGNIFLPIPPLEEQKVIADYLDTQTAKITHFIQTKQRFIELLKEQRQSIITNAVTKGIDDSVKMKETGIDWMPQIPEHWEVRRLGSIGKFSKGGNISRSELICSDEGVCAILYGDLYTKYDIIAENIINHITKNTAVKSVEVKTGDLLFTGSGETKEDIGKCVIFNGYEPTYAGGDVIIFKQDIFDSFFISYSQNSSIAKYQKNISSKGEIIVHTYGSKLRDVIMPYPPTIEEQKCIVEYIKTETKCLDIAIGKAEREIELIKEYREAMIAEAVTGKIKL